MQDIKCKISESELQKWFELRSREQNICEKIVNIEELNKKTPYIKEYYRESERTKKEGLYRAKEVYNALFDSKHLSGNLNISTADSTQMRPDLTLISPDANYILVELKTEKKAERQTVQELLAYSAAIKIQRQFMNEFMFVIVASHWDTLLTAAVQAMIMDEKKILPLKVSRCPDRNEFELYINIEVFDFIFSKPYDPFKAMHTYTKATTIYDIRKHNKEYITTRSIVCNYLKEIAIGIKKECKKINQSGFVVFFSDKKSDSERLCITVATVNENWRYNEQAGDSQFTISDDVNEGIAKVHRNEVKRKRKEILKDSSLDPENMNYDPFLISDAYSEEEALYSQSSLSVNMLFKESNYLTEKIISKSNSNNIQGFEFGSSINLKQFLHNESPYSNIEGLYAFGDLEDFLYKKDNFKIWHHANFCFSFFNDLIIEFRKSKIIY
ncbi:hypothetical protein [Pectobacterium punjabense]|uniref:hypothetical protein n=1 Tax=Pectobacterium punjabense TaxID=2108399 RepID=UPI003D9BEBB8